MREPQAALTLEMVGLGVRWPIAIESSVLEIVGSLQAALQHHSEKHCEPYAG